MSLNREKILERKKELLNPPVLDGLEELEKIVEPKPNYVGPGPWLKVCRRLSEELGPRVKIDSKGGSDANN